MWAKPGDGLNMKVLWTDSPYAMQRVEGLHQAGGIDDQERADLTHFIDHGRLIWPAAIPPDLVDQFAADIRGHHRHPGKIRHHRPSQQQARPEAVRQHPGPLRKPVRPLRQPSLRAGVCFHPRISRFLSLVFGTRPVANQQLLFQRSNGHRVHQDTSVVAVEDPMLIAATWIALEDVQEGSGELAFYDRSHRLPHYLFKDGSKRMTFGVDDQTVYNDDLRASCQKAGMEYQRFLAKKGDVFFWTADLVHRSHDRALPADTSRLSCVTHYHPETTVPFWFRFHPDRQHIKDSGDRGAYVSVHYRLSDKQRGMLGPELSSR